MTFEEFHTHVKQIETSVDDALVERAAEYMHLMGEVRIKRIDIIQ